MGTTVQININRLSETKNFWVIYVCLWKNWLQGNELGKNDAE